MPRDLLLLFPPTPRAIYKCKNHPSSQVLPNRGPPPSSATRSWGPSAREEQGHRVLGEGSGASAPAGTQPGRWPESPVLETARGSALCLSTGPGGAQGRSRSRGEVEMEHNSPELRPPHCGAPTGQSRRVGGACLAADRLGTEGLIHPGGPAHTSLLCPDVPPGSFTRLHDGSSPAGSQLHSSRVG